MKIVPVIYILDGKTVALYKGTLDQKEQYSKSPLEFAKKFEREGAKEIYIVDLNASEFGTEENTPLIKQIRNSVSVPMIFAGGVRTMEKLKEVFDMGFERAVLGVYAESIYKEAIEAYGADKIIIGIKAKGDEVITEKKSPFPLRVIDFAEKLPAYGVKYVLFKDLWKESTQIGPNYDEADRILRMTDLKVYTSGGISKVKHLQTLKEIGILGAFIGKAFYEGELNLDEVAGNY